MKTRTMGVAACLAAALALSACSSGSSSDAPSDGSGRAVKVGVVLSLSGAGAPFGIAGEKTLTQLAKDYNASSATPKVELKVVDDESQAAKALTSAQALASWGADVVLGGSISSVAVPLSAQLQSDGVPFIATAVDQRITEPTPGQINSMVFQTPESQALNIGIMLTYCRDHGIKKVGMIYDSTALGQGANDQLTAQAPQYGIEIVAAESIDTEAGTAVPQLSKVQRAGAEALLVYAGHVPAPLVQRNFAAMGWDVPIIQSSEALVEGFRENAGGDAAVGVLAPSVKFNVGDQLPDSDPQKAVIADWTAFADKNLGGVDALQIYYADAWKIFEQGMSGLKSPDTYSDLGAFRDAFVQNVGAIKDYPGLVGIRTFTPTDHRGLSPTGTMLLVRLTADGLEIAN